MTYSTEELLRITLSNQHLLTPTDNIKQIVKDLCGIQAQYFNNSLHMLRVRYNTDLDHTCLKGLIKTWTVRGTLHIISKDDLSLFVSATQNDWFTRWGTYLKKYFTPDERSQWEKDLYKLIHSGIRNREKMITFLDEKGVDQGLLKIALSSWGGILKDLAYQGKILYEEVDKNDFISCNSLNLIDEEQAKIQLLERYLVGYAPATVNDFAYWSQFKVSEVKKLIKKVKMPLQTMSDHDHNDYYLLPERSDQSKNPIPKFIFLAGFDPLMLGYKDKKRFLIKPEYHEWIFKKNGFIKSVLLDEGQVIGIWKKDKREFNIQLFEDISKKDQRILLDKIHHDFTGEIQKINLSKY
ncbi:MAG: winged helix DNA-binding domain-containing protein [Halanaerobiales bacterium]|nr:winged helix DNA-binding domain-containing protein [Halanaerobiales bacterium]